MSMAKVNNHMPAWMEFVVYCSLYCGSVQYDFKANI